MRLGFGIWILEFGVCNFEFDVLGLGFAFWSFGFGILKFVDTRLETWVSDLEILEFRTLSLGF